MSRARVRDSPIAAIRSVRHDLQLSPAIASPSKLGSESASAERVGSFAITSGWRCSGGQVLPQRWGHIARSTLRAEALAQLDRGRRQRTERGDVDRLAVHHASPEHLCLDGGGREAAQQPEPDLRAVIEAAHVSDEGVDQIAKAARRGRTAVEAGQEILTSPACPLSREAVRGLGSAIATANKCLAQSNKSRTKGDATMQWVPC
jgi:hypothetical protein